MRLRNDDAAWRIALHVGDADDLAYLGWYVDGPDGLAAAGDAVSAAGCDVHAATPTWRPSARSTRSPGSSTRSGSATS